MIAFFFLAVENPHRIPVEPRLAVLAEFRPLVPQKVLQQQPVLRPAFRTANRIDQQIEIAQAQIFKKADRQRNNFGVHRRTRRPDGFDSKLVKLAESSRLRPVIPEHRPDVEQLGRLRIRVQFLFQIGADHGGGVFRTQGDAAAASVVKGVHFLLHHVGGFADAAQK